MSIHFHLSIVPDSEAVAAYAFTAVADPLSRLERPVLGVATGSSPEGLYRLLAQACADGRFDASRLRAFALDEYVGIDPADPRSFAATLRRQVTESWGLDAGRIRVPDGRAADLDAECASFEADIREAGGVDVQIVGLGGNGHLAFNEPGSARDSRTRVVELDERTRRDNARFFEMAESVPRWAVTQGIATILEARRIVALAVGEGKAGAVARAVVGPIDASCPASFLRLHPDVVVIVDEAAARLLPR
ncbi:glucosamine-6-phosphate deaminase [Microbacterium trichothecenolyticum]|uniref:Glucosamine-6-phosphate deaminase n=1 Tax=Microbacterium trichothecenolyticum TaxID=69370 RepID=A0ABU0TX06_MICTR|nr:glucosamine-6-phosphate deaminase [Microbacterium trichothecenolyticum]MDQ1123467.1 glucosamine-6-phosphate deaminase [Microbacterium trichothecenolyticum]